MTNRIENLRKRLNDVIEDLGQEDGVGLKKYEIAFQEAIESVYPDYIWWQVTNYWDIFDALFFLEMTPEEVADEIVKKAEEFEKTEHIEESVFGQVAEEVFKKEEDVEIKIEHGKTIDEYMEKFGELYNEGELWDFEEEDILSGAVKPRKDIVYWEIDGRLYETTDKAVEECTKPKVQEEVPVKEKTKNKKPIIKRLKEATENYEEEAAKILVKLFKEAKERFFNDYYEGGNKGDIDDAIEMAILSTLHNNFEDGDEAEKRYRDIIMLAGDMAFPEDLFKLVKDNVVLNLTTMFEDDEDVEELYEKAESTTEGVDKKVKGQKKLARKKVNENFESEFNDNFDYMVEIATEYYNYEGDIVEAVQEAMDRGLMYHDDVVMAAGHYLSSETLTQMFYEELYQDLYDAVKEELEEDDKVIEESTAEPLEPVYDHAKSFYKKAHVVTDDDGTKVLISYNTPVCKIDKDGEVTLLRDKRTRLSWSASPTTLRHVKEFLRQNGKKVVPLRELPKVYKEETI